MVNNNKVQRRLQMNRLAILVRWFFLADKKGHALGFTVFGGMLYKSFFKAGQLLAVVSFMAQAVYVNAIPGDLDLSFGVGGKVVTSSVSSANSLVRQSDGKLVTVGNYLSGSYYDFGLVRYNSDGSLDTSFDGDGKVSTALSSYDDKAEKVIQQTDGKLVAVGHSSSGTWSFAVARYNSNGTIDATFSGDGKQVTAIGSSDAATAVIQQSDGKLLIGGSAYGSSNDFALVRYNIDGTLDTAFGGDGKVTTTFAPMNSQIMSLFQQTDGKLVAAGYRSTVSGSSYDFVLVRYNLDGSLDTSFDGDGISITSNGICYSAIRQVDGKIVAAGYISGSGGGFKLVRYNENGSLDASFNGTGVVFTTIVAGHLNNAATSVIQQSDGKLIAVGSSSNGTNTVGYFVAVRYNQNGSIDTTFSGDGKVLESVNGVSGGRSVIEQPDGKIVISGFSETSGAALMRIESGQPDSDFDGVIDGIDSDDDGDGVLDGGDNCPLVPNSTQTNTDSDGQGDACDADDDNDGVLDVNDAFPLNAAESVDNDGDGTGNNADPDDDNDGVLDVNDAFPLNVAESADTDGDGTGNNADLDDDNDGVPDTLDAFPLNAAESADTDGDGTGNNADLDDDNDGVLDVSDAFPLDASASSDSDGDGVADNLDNCPFTSNPTQLNTDGDSAGDACDLDDDNDGVADADDAFPLNAAETINTDGDGIGNNADTDDDGDGVADASDNCPLVANADQANSNASPAGNACDPSTTYIGSGLVWDASNWDQNLWTFELLDSDNDGVFDNEDAFPQNPAEWLDTDGDGIGNNADLDDDNDGLTDLQEIARGTDPLLADMDADGVSDLNDVFPANATKTVADDVNWVALSDAIPNGSVDTVVNIGTDTYIAGAFTLVGNVAANRIARWDGENWSSLGTGLNGAVYAMTIDGSGNLVVAGSFTTADGATANNIAQWDGVSWTALGSGTNGAVRSLVTDANGNVYAGGAFTAVNGSSANRIAKWDGFGWSTLGTGMNNTVYALAIDTSGNVYAGGSFGTAGGVTTNKIAKWDGFVWAAMASGMGGSLPNVLSLATDTAGNVYAGGAFTTAGGITVNRVAKWSGSAWQAMGSGMNGNVLALRVVNNTVFAGGAFTTASGVAASRIAMWNGTTWLPLDSGVNNSVTAFALDYFGNLVVSGTFTSAGSHAFQRVARWLLLDSDNDGYGDEVDPYPTDIYNGAMDIDHDGIPNPIDLDDDGDGVPDYIDADPLNPAINIEKVLPASAIYKGAVITEVNVME